MNHALTILSEEFEVPACNCDLQELIETAINDLEFIPEGRKQTRESKQAINKLIDEYNERRNCKIYNHV